MAAVDYGPELFWRKISRVNHFVKIRLAELPASIERNAWPGVKPFRRFSRFAPTPRG